MSKKSNPLVKELNKFLTDKCMAFHNFLPQSTSDEGVKQRFLNLYRKFVDVITYAKLMMLPSDKLTPTSIKKAVLVIATPIGEENEEIIFKIQEAPIDDATLKAAYDRIKKKHRSNIKNLTKKEKHDLLEKYIIEEVKTMRSTLAKMKEVDSSSFLIPVGLGEVTWKIYAEHFEEVYGYKPTTFSFSDWTHYSTVRVDTRGLEFVISNPVQEADYELQSGSVNSPVITELPDVEEEIAEPEILPVQDDESKKRTYIFPTFEGTYKDTGSTLSHFMYYRNEDLISGRGGSVMEFSDIPDDTLDVPDDTRDIDEFAVEENNNDKLESIPQIPSFEETFNEVVDDEKKRKLQLINDNINNILTMPVSSIDKDIALAVVTKDGSYLAFIPIEVRDGEVCLKAVLNNPAALQDVPLEIIGEVLFNYLVEYMKDDNKLISSWAIECRKYLGNIKEIEDAINLYNDKFKKEDSETIVPEISEAPTPVFASSNNYTPADFIATLNANAIPVETPAEEVVEQQSDMDPLAALDASAIPVEEPAEEVVEQQSDIDPLAALDASAIPVETPVEEVVEQQSDIDPLAALDASAIPVEEPTEEIVEQQSDIDPLAALDASAIPVEEPAEEVVEQQSDIDPLAALDASAIPVEEPAEEVVEQQVDMDPLAALDASAIPVEEPAEEIVEQQSDIDPLAALDASAIPVEEPTEEVVEQQSDIDPLAALAALNASDIPEGEPIEKVDTATLFAEKALAIEELNASAIPVEEPTEEMELPTEEKNPETVVNASAIPVEEPAEVVVESVPSIFGSIRETAIPVEFTIDEKTDDTNTPASEVNVDEVLSELKILVPEEQAETVSENVETPSSEANLDENTVDTPASDVSVDDVIGELKILVPEAQIETVSENVETPSSEEVSDILPEELTPLEIHELPSSEQKDDTVSVDQLLEMIESGSKGEFKPENPVEIKTTGESASYEDLMSLIDAAEKELKDNQQIMTDLSSEMGLPKPSFEPKIEVQEPVKTAKTEETDRPLTQEEIDELVEEIKKENELKDKTNEPKTKYDYYSVEQLIEDIKAEKLAKAANEQPEEIEEEKNETNIQAPKKVRVYKINSETGEREMLTEKPKFMK